MCVVMFAFVTAYACVLGKVYSLLLSFPVSLSPCNPSSCVGPRLGSIVPYGERSVLSPSSACTSWCPGCSCSQFDRRDTCWWHKCVVGLGIRCLRNYDKRKCIASTHMYSSHTLQGEKVSPLAVCV